MLYDTFNVKTCISIPVVIQYIQKSKNQYDVLKVK